MDIETEIQLSYLDEDIEKAIESFSELSEEDKDKIVTRLNKSADEHDVTIQEAIRRCSERS